MQEKVRVASLAMLVLAGCSGGTASGGGGARGATAPPSTSRTSPAPTVTPPVVSPPVVTPPISTPAPGPRPQPTPTPPPPVRTPGPPVKGIDVSQWQGTIDWAQVAAAGYGFAFARVSHGFYRDTQFARNWPEMKAHGVVRGAYQFFDASTDGAQQADDFLAVLGPLDADDLPPVCDVETLSGASVAQLEAEVQKWVDRVRAVTGRKPLVYTSPGFWNGKLNHGFGCDLWVAHWGVSAPVVPNGWTDWVFWQQSSTGTIPGINGAVDEDEFHGSLADLKVFIASGLLPAPPPVPAPAPPPPPGTTPTGTTYTVKSGDTLSGIAAQHGVTLAALLAANPQITNPNLIFAGQVINIPGGAAPPPPPPPPSAPAVPDADAAIGYCASDPVNPNTGTKNWYLWCLGLVNQAWRAAGHVAPELQAATARASYDAFAKTAVVHDIDLEPPPRGAILYWDWVSSGVNYGHTAIANGDGTCATTCAPGTGTNGGTINLRAPISSFALKKLGWVDPVTRR